MSGRTYPKKQFSGKKQLLTLYLSIGIMGICMLVFSAWTPHYTPTTAEQNKNHLSDSEHTPSNSQNNSSDNNAPTTAPSDTATPEDDNSSPGTAGDSNLPASATPSPTLSPTPSPSPTPIPNPLLTDAIPEINALVENYYDAKLSGDINSFTGLVSDISTIDIDYLQIQYGLVKSFSNFTCYIKNGINEIAYVVYVSYDSEIATIKTPVPILDRITLVYANDGSGTLQINTANDYSDEAKAYFDEIFAHEDVRLMYEKETARFEAALASDVDLQQLYNRLSPEGAE